MLLLLSWLLPVPAAENVCPELSFAPARQVATGLNLQSIQAEDFNGDRHLDLVLADHDSNALLIHLGKGDGSFETALLYGVRMGPRSIAVSDFNGDGKADVSVANATSADVSVLLGSGNGFFEATNHYATGPGATFVTARDFNGDGTQDLVVANSGIIMKRRAAAGDVALLLGKGDGTFQAAVNFPAGTTPVAIAVADFDRDGKFDLAIQNEGKLLGGIGPLIENSVSIHLGQGDGTFMAPVFHYGSTDGRFITTGDLNRDSMPDLVVANSNSANVSVLLGNGDGSFQRAVTYDAGWGPLSVVVDDLNGDARSDLLVANGLGCSVLLGKGDGSFHPAIQYSAGSLSSSVVLGDFNADSKPDLAVANVATAWVLRNTCGSTGVELSVLRQGSHVTVSWPFSSQGFVLQATPTLNPATWTPIFELPKTNATGIEITFEIKSNERYFRLYRP